ncbi:18780_t:CDS:1, partial [Gigaspora margarita]
MQNIQLISLLDIKQSVTKRMIAQLVPLNKHTRKDTINTSTSTCFSILTKTDEEAKTSDYSILLL